MKEFNVKSANGEFILNLPTSVAEITNSDYFLKVSEGIELPDDHSLIALVYKEKLPIVLATTNKPKNQGTAVIPFFVKSGHTESKYIQKLKPNSPIIIDGSDIARGHHVNCKYNYISMSAVYSICRDTEVAKNSIKDMNTYCFVDFKIVPNCDIHGNYPIENIPYVSPFLINNSSNIN